MKAIVGAALIAGAVALDIFSGGTASALTGLEMAALGSIFSMGVSMEVGAIADALTANRGMNITTRQAAACRQIIYGTQRVGGVNVYRSTTGSHKDQFNFVIVLAGHPCWAIQNLYLDGRQVYWQGSGDGWTVQNGVGFGGNPDGDSHEGPNGVQYNFNSLVYCEARYGNQVSGTDVIGALTANDGNWIASGGNSPDLMGCTYVYLKLEANANQFPGEPEVRFTVMGKPLYDPRTSTTVYSSNWALVANDIITDSVFGLGDSSVNQAQLIAAANVCDEQIYSAIILETESRYACHHHYDTGSSPGDALNMIMPAAGGRLSRIGGEWYLWPAYWQGPSFSFDESHFTGAVEWKPYRSFRDLYNRVNGTYIAPNFPWNIAGNLYDGNGFFNGETQNNFPFAFQPTNFPQYAADVLHGYASDEWLTADGGKQLPKELTLSTVLSVSQAQRLAKICLLRNRQQGSGTFHLNLDAWQMQPTDVVNFTFPQNGWTDKILEVTSVKFQLSDGSQGEPPTIRAEFEMCETAETVYEWSDVEELTVYAIPAVGSQVSYSPAPPTNMTLISSAGTALLNADGSVVPRIEVTWDTPLDILVKQIQVQYQLTGAAAWTDAGMVDVSLNASYITPVVAGSVYDVRIRSIRANGATSIWEEIDGMTAGLVFSILTQDGVGRGSLVGEAYADGTAAIECTPFTTLVGNTTLSIFPSGAYTISALVQQTLYYVYYVDLTYVGGNVTPIATTNQADFVGKLGYFLIDAIVTPYCSSSGSSSSSMPTTSSDTGSRTTTNPASAYDGNISTFALVSGSAISKYSGGEATLTTAKGICTWSGFTPTITTVDMTLTVVTSSTTSVSTDATAGTYSVQADVSGGPLTAMTNGGTGTFTMDIPSGTNLATVSIAVTATPGDADATSSFTSAHSSINVNVYEIYIQ